jgi:hypothetical protein
VLKKIVIVAERAAGAGLTENARFPMMKTREKIGFTTEAPFGFAQGRLRNGEEQNL